MLLARRTRITAACGAATWAACGLAMLVAGAAIAQPPGNGNYRLPNDICGCGDAMGVCLDGAPHTERFWVRGEALIWQLEGQVLPPLLTFGLVDGTPPAELARLDAPGTRIIAGSHVANDDWRAGWGLSGGVWVDDIRRTAVVWDYLQVGRHTFEANVRETDNDPTVFAFARPFFDVETNQQGRLLISGETQSVVSTTDAVDLDLVTTVTTNDFLRGTAQVRAYEDFYTTGVALQHRFRELSQHCEVGHSGQMSWIVGYRHYHDDSFLGIRTNVSDFQSVNTRVVNGNVEVSNTTVNTTFLTSSFDNFSASNNFHGAELGLTARVERWGWWLEGLTTLSIGGNRRTVTLQGQTTESNATAGGAPEVTNSSLYITEGTNAGRYSDTQATVIPRLRGGVGCQLTPRLSLRSGYSAIIWPDAVRAADHVPPNLAVDQRNLPDEDPTGATDNPRFPGIQGRTIVAHGFDMALELRY